MVLEGLPPVALRRIARGPVEEVHVEIVGPEALKGALAILLDVARGHVASARDLGRNHQLLAPPGVLRHPAADDLLRPALGPPGVARDRVLLGGVHEVDSTLEHGAVEEGVAEGLVGAVVVGAAPPLGAQAELADHDVRPPQPPLAHAVDDLEGLAGGAGRGVTLSGGPSGLVRPSKRVVDLKPPKGRCRSAPLDHRAAADSTITGGRLPPAGAGPERGGAGRGEGGSHLDWSPNGWST
mmetsp:Transcript_60927/g.193268  ORF Transcript_60927/g.193268 Transcript_60927/m.193268 type:complete len:239 (-) Transcript_60927:10-726(-)